MPERVRRYIGPSESVANSAQHSISRDKVRLPAVRGEYIGAAVLNRLFSEHAKRGRADDADLCARLSVAKYDIAFVGNPGAFEPLSLVPPQPTQPQQATNSDTKGMPEHPRVAKTLPPTPHTPPAHPAG